MKFTSRANCAWLLTGVSSLAMALATSASAQQTATAKAAEPQEVIVTGYRASLQSALDAKRISTLPIESVAPEDIGKMPDQNVAESLQRLPGIQIDRTFGKGTSVLIDGLRQNLTTLNGDVFLTGKEFYVSGEAANGGNGSNALYSSLEGVPSEEVGRIDVYKNPNASLTEGGLGGIIDLRSRDPRDAKMGFSLGGNFRVSSADGDQHSSTPNGTLVATYKPNADFAITGSVSYDDQDTHTKEYEAYNRGQWILGNYATSPYPGPLTGATTTRIGQNYILPQYGYFSDIYDRRKTTGASLGLSWRLSNSLKTTLNYFYSRETESTINYTDKVGFNGSGATSPGPIPGIDPTKPFSIDANGVVASGTFNLTGAETQTLFQGNKSQAHNVQWRTDWDNGGPLTGGLDVAYARANSNLQAAAADVEHGYYSAFGQTVSAAPSAPGCNNFGANCTTGNHGYEIQWSGGGSSGLPSAIALAPYADVNSNPAYVLAKSNWAWANLTRQEQESVRGDLHYRPAFLNEASAVISAGFRFANRDVDQTFGRYLIDGGAGVLGANNCCADPNGGSYLYYLDPGYVAIPYATGASSPSLFKTVNNFGVGAITVRTPGDLMNPSTFLNAVWNAGAAANRPAGALATNNSEKFFVDTLSSFKVSEQTTSGYVMVDLGGKTSRYHANFGVRIVSTDLEVDGAQTAPVPKFYGTASWNGVNSNNIPVTTNRSYIDVLPSLNFVLNVTDSQVVRVSAARVVSPADLFPLGLGNSYGFTRETGGRINPTTGLKDGFKFSGGSSGNAYLDPYRANQVYASWEDYFARGDLISVAAFYKQVDNFVETQNIPTTVMDDFGGTTANVTKPVNAGRGSIYGFELGGQYAFHDVVGMPFLNGFGVAANYTLSQSFSGQATAYTNSLPIPGVSRHSLTTTAYYESHGFGARLSYSWRSKAVNDGIGGSTFSFANASGVQKVYGVYSAPYGQLDAQVSYDINSRIGVVLSAQNLSNEKPHTYLQFSNQAFTYDDSGTRYFLGFKFKY